MFLRRRPSCAAKNSLKGYEVKTGRSGRFRSALGCLVSALLLANGCVEAAPKRMAEAVASNATPKILAMGDSLLAWHRGSHRSIPDAVETQLGTEVIDRSVIAARYNYILPITGALGLNIAKQYRKGNWDWVILNGGGNDLWFGCGCVACDAVIDKLITADGRSGKIPDLVRRIRSTGARVVYVGYLHSPGVYSIVDHCKDDDLEFEKRLGNFAASHDGVYFLPVSNLVPAGDRSFHSGDMIHPSVKGSSIIGAKIAQIIRGAGK